MPITQETLLIWLLVGAVAGWLANQVMKGWSYGVVEDIVIGMLGAVVAGHLFRTPGIRPAECMVAAIGAFVLLLVARFVRRAT